MIQQIESTYITVIEELIKNYRTKEIESHLSELPPITPELMSYEECLAFKMMSNYIETVDFIHVTALQKADEMNCNEEGVQKIEFDFEYKGTVYFANATIANTETNFRFQTELQPSESDFQSTIAIYRITTFDEENNEIEVQLK